MIGAVAERDPALAARIRRTGLMLAGIASALFLLSLGIILLRWWRS